MDFLFFLFFPVAKEEVIVVWRYVLEVLNYSYGKRRMIVGLVRNLRFRNQRGHGRKGRLRKGSEAF